MLRNYFRFVFRNLKRSPGYLSINIIGLAVGIATVLLIALYIQHELSYDQYHTKKEQIYRLDVYAGYGEKSWRSYVSGDPVPEMRKSFTGVEDATKYMNCGTNFISLEEKRFEDITMICGESNLFNIFSFDLVSGDASQLLDAPNTMVITRSLSMKLFGDENPVGKSIPINFSDGKNTEFEITGLMEDVPANSHFRFDLVISYSSLESTRRCTTCGQPMYVLLEEGVNTEEVASRALTHIREIDGKENVEDLQLEPLTEIYFSNITERSQGNFKYVLIMGAIAALVLLIGCANYMNLSTARFSQRSKEIGVRKVLGAHRFELMKQFYLETIILAILALPLAFILLTIALPYFNYLADTELVFNWLGNYSVYITIFALLITISLIAGSYPALFLSSFKPSEVIKGTLKPGMSATGIRKGLVVFQFLIAMIMIVVTGVIMQQLYFIQEKNLGFDTDQVISARMGDPAFTSKYKVVREEFRKIASVKHVSASAGVPMRRGGSHYIHKLENGEMIEFVTPVIDPAFLSTLNVKLIAGRNISEELPEGRSRETLINKSGVKAMGWENTQDAIGREISSYKIVGVTEDFHIKPLDEEIQPVLMSQNYWGMIPSFLIKLEGGNIPGTLESLKTAWENMGTAGPLEIEFVDDQIDKLYEKEQKTAKVIGIFAILSIIVGCLGLFGLATFMTERRIKEIGIRKVLGASIPNIITLLVKDFGKLVLVSFLIAVPLAYIISNKWLDNFVYRIEVGPSVFIVSGILVLLIALISTGIRSLQAAMKNPANTLKN